MRHFYFSFVHFELYISGSKRYLDKSLVGKQIGGSKLAKGVELKVLITVGGD